MLLGAGMLHYAYRLAHWQNEQIEAYNFGIAATAHGNAPLAQSAFRASIRMYQDASHAPWVVRVLYPQPNREYAALAYFQLGKAYMGTYDAQLAVEAWKQSLRLNPGNGYENMSSDEANRLHVEAMYVKHALKQLFKQYPNLANQQGKGASAGQGDGTGPGSHVPGDDPASGSSAGKGDPNDL
jgi:hypothetical protein